MDSPPRVLSGRYELVHLVARGGMAEVYRAHDRLLDRPVALKILFSELSVDRTFVERFRLEAQRAAKLSHPNIVPVFDWGEDAGTYFIVMEFIDGRPLSSILKTAGPLHPDRAAEVAADVALALDYAHHRGVIHRDIKPGNILITDEGQVKVTDFGIARAINADESLTQTGAVMGTATYFSPEQAEGQGVDARSDIYALGVVLYEMVSGRPPFTGDSPVAVASLHVREQAPAPRQFNPSVPPDLEAIILKCMAKSPEYRYPSGSELRVDLLRFHEGRKVLAGPVPTGPTVIQNRTQAIPLLDEPHEEEEESTRTGLYVAVLVILLIALAVVLLFLGNTLGWWHLGGSSSFSLPNVTGQSFSRAESTLSAKGLKTTKKTVPSSAAKKNQVTGMSPSAGSRVHSGQTITLDVGSGTPAVQEVAVPEVVGYVLGDAEKAIKGVGLKYAVIQGTCSYPNNEVCVQSPSYPSNLPKGATVLLTVSNQTTTTLATQHFVPGPLAGETTAKACATIVANGLTCAPKGEWQYQTSGTVQQGLVIGTLPQQGTPELSGSAVNLEVSEGVQVPNVVGQSEQAATSTLANDGFNPSVKKDKSDKNPADCGNVTGQNPAGNSFANAGTTVQVTVGAGPTCNGNQTTTTTTASTTSIVIPGQRMLSGSEALAAYERSRPV